MGARLPRMVKLLDSRGNPLRGGSDRPARQVSARYDAAQISEEMRRHWAETDHLSARAANSPEVRRRLRERARYETDNNGWAEGIADTLADWLIGDGPKLQMVGTDRDAGRRIESAWKDWAEQVGFAEKLWLMRRMKAVDGEAFLFLDTDPDLHPVQLDLRLFECDCIATPFQYPLDPLATDGIVFNTRMKPKEYHLLRTHPGDFLGYGYMWEFDKIPARYVIHWFKRRRAQQYRGIPEITPVLDLFANVRRHGMAVLAAAETAADFAAVLESQLPPEEDDPAGVAWSKTAIEKRMMTTLPDGYKLSQLRAEQPTQGHGDFVKVNMMEMARPYGMPYSLAAGDYSQENYSSGRLGHQAFNRKLKVDRCHLETICLNRVFAAWLGELAMTTDLVPGGADREGGWPHRWIWPGAEHVDPKKEADAQEIRLRNGTTSFAEECYEDGVDADERLAMIAEYVPQFKEAGFTPAWMQTPAQAQSKPQPQGDAEDGDQTDNQGGQAGYANGHLVHRNGHLRP